jgi:hypothetical protein
MAPYSDLSFQSLVTRLGSTLTRRESTPVVVLVV